LTRLKVLNVVSGTVATQTPSTPKNLFLEVSAWHQYHSSLYHIDIDLHDQRAIGSTQDNLGLDIYDNAAMLFHELAH